jgi:hypothetical protein
MKKGSNHGEEKGLKAQQQRSKNDSQSSLVRLSAFEWGSQLLREFWCHEKNPDFVLDREINAHLLVQCTDA